MKYHMQEGSLTLGEGEWQDRTINMLSANHLPAKGTNLVITREPLPPGVGFADYIDNQKNILKKELSHFELMNDSPDTINELASHFLEFIWKNQGIVMYQMMSIINNNGTVINLTASVPETIDEDTRTTLFAAMKSFETRPLEQEDASK